MNCSGAEVLLCAGCGIVEGGDDDAKLRKCTACKSVRYCSVKCQREHRPQHKQACKKLAVELRDEILFKQPEESDMGDCPICCLPHSAVEGNSMLQTCCGKLICMGCAHANRKHELQGKHERKCPFCRQPVPTSWAEIEAYFKKRVAVNDPLH
jgi:hypothetical protein